MGAPHTVRGSQNIFTDVSVGPGTVFLNRKRVRLHTRMTQVHFFTEQKGKEGEGREERKREKKRIRERREKKTENRRREKRDENTD